MLLSVRILQVAAPSCMRILLCCAQAPYLPEKSLTCGNASVMTKVFLEGDLGIRNKGAFTEEDVQWFRHSFCQPGAATAALNYYRALIWWQLFGDPDGPAWR